MKTFFLLFLSVLTLSLHAQQVTKVAIQASGLTCSMCSNSINKALKTVDFVSSVKPDIETSTFDITFKPNSKIDFERLKKKVEDAGFFVSNFTTTVQFNNVAVKPNVPVLIGDNSFLLTNLTEGKLNGEKNLRILNKGFVSGKAYKKNPVAANTAARVYYASI